MNIKPMLSGDRVCKAMTGLTVKEVENLEIEFSWNLKEAYAIRKPNRKRKIGGGFKGHLPDSLHKLVVSLMYLKVYPTFDVMGVLCQADRSRCCRWMQFFLPVLEKTLGRKLVLPIRQITSVEEFFRLYPEAKDVFVDGTDRRVQKPVSQKRRTKLYYGKRKTTTRKNIIVADEDRRILVLSPTKSGRRHDKRLADKAEITSNLPGSVTAWTDTGFQGMQHTHPNIMMPKKGSKHKPLTEAERENNRIISSFRMVSEHAIAGIKRLRCVSDVYRNRLPNLDDRFMLLSTGIWNYHLSFKTATVI